MNYLSHLPLAIVAVAVVAFGLVLLRDYLRTAPGPIIDTDLLMAQRRIRAFNRRLDMIRRRFDHE